MEDQVKKKTSLLKIIVISLLVLALIIFIGYLAIIYGLKHNTTEFGKNVSVFVGWLIYYFSSIAVHNKETWYGKLIAETMAKRWYIDVNVFGDVIKDASFAVVVLLLSIIVFFIIIIILEIDSILNKREYLVKGFILLSVCCLVFGGGFYVYKYTPFVENIKKEQEKARKTC